MSNVNDSDESTSDENESVSRKSPSSNDSDGSKSEENESVGQKIPCLNDSDGSTSDENEFLSQTNRADTYELEKFSQNLLIIFNHLMFADKLITRFGTMNDQRTLQKTFMELNFKCSMYNDLREHEILKTMQKYGEKDFTDYGCVFVAIMTHGDHRGQLHAYDYTFSEYDLIKCITRNRTLVGKPVVFLIEATRGIIESSMKRSSFHDETLYHQLRPDILLFYSSPIGLPSFWRHDGSFFIQSLCKQINLLADQEDFETICRAVMREFALDIRARILVGDRVKTFKQKPVLTSMLIRRLYFGPVRNRNITSFYERIQVKETYTVAESYPDLNAPTYELEKKKKNLMIIFSHENFLNNTRRESSTADAKNLKITFEEFGFEVTTHKDENMTDLFEKLTAFSKQDFSACGCVCVAVLTHGSAHGFLEACDVGYSERALFAAFDALANRSLAGKPIVFLIQASRGAKPAGRICVPRLDELPDSSIQLDAAGGSQAKAKYLPTEANMIIFHSCFRGRAVPKDDRSGSCFVQTLCSQVRSHGGSEHLEKIFRRVRRLVAETSPQMPVTSSTLLKKLFLQRSSKTVVGPGLGASSPPEASAVRLDPHKAL